MELPRSGRAAIFLGPKTRPLMRCANLTAIRLFEHIELQIARFAHLIRGRVFGPKKIAARPLRGSSIYPPILPNHYVHLSKNAPTFM
jgi:hypothetical protein